jgi:beta-N-acetylhexosaminidase
MKANFTSRFRARNGLVLVFFVCCSMAHSQTPDSATHTTPALKDSVPPCLSDIAKAMVQELTTEDKAAQMLLVYHSPVDFMLQHKFGGSLIMSNMLKKPEALAKDIAQLQSQAPIPVLITIDQEGGQVDRMKVLEGVNPMARAESLSAWSADSIVEYTRSWAKKMRQLGINTNLAPVLDPSIDYTGSHTFMKEKGRAFGKDSAQIVPPALAFIKGFYQEQVLCITKHFPGYDVQTNSDHELAVSLADSMAIKQQIKAFAGTQTQAGGVMMNSIHYTQFSQKPAVFDSTIVGWAREVYPDAIIMTDDLWGTALRAFIAQQPEVHSTKYPARHLQALTLAAFDAGNDMLMITFPAKAVLMKKYIAEACKKDPARMQKLNEATYRIILAKLKAGLL